MRTKKEVENEIVNIYNLIHLKKSDTLLDIKGLKAVKHALIWAMDHKTDHAAPSECGHIFKS